MSNACKTTPLILLVRVSTDRQARGSDSPQVQEEYLRQWAKLSGHEVVAVYGKRDEGVSGTVRALEREDTAAALAHALRLKCPLAVYSLDRLGRDGIDLMETGTMLVDKGSNLIAPGDGINLAMLRKTAVGKYLHWVMAGTAQLVRDLIAEKTTLALRSRKQEGRRTGGDVPYGKMLDATRQRTRVRNGEEEETYHSDLVDYPQEQAVLRRIEELCRLHRNGRGPKLREIAAILTAEGVRTRAGGRVTSGWLRRRLRVVPPCTSHE